MHRLYSAWQHSGWPSWSDVFICIHVPVEKEGEERGMREDWTVAEYGGEVELIRRNERAEKSSTTDKRCSGNWQTVDTLHKRTWLRTAVPLLPSPLPHFSSYLFSPWCTSYSPSTFFLQTLIFIANSLFCFWVVLISSSLCLIPCFQLLLF